MYMFDRDSRQVDSLLEHFGMTREPSDHNLVEWADARSHHNWLDLLIDTTS